MNDETLEVIASTHTGVLGTLCEDGSPYVTPVTYTFSNDIFTWQSAPDAVHSQNIVRDSRVSFTIIEATDKDPRAVYINTHAQTTGESSYNEAWKQELEKFQFKIGKLDTNHSTPGRFYYKGTR